MVKTAPKSKKPKIKEGESTGIQRKNPVSGWGSTNSQMPVFFDAAPGTYDVYRRISKDPTTALVMVIVKAAILANEWNYEKADDDVPDDVVEFVKKNLDPLRHDFVRDCMHALEMSWAAFEKIWELNEDLDWIVTRCKPLLVDVTELLEDDHGITGLRNKVPKKPVINLPLNKCVYHINDPQPGYPYGISRHENIRQIWSEKEQLRQRLAQYMRKVSGIIVQLHMPEGTSKNAAGADYANQWIGQQILDAVSAGYSVMFTNMCSLADPTKDPELAAKLAGHSSWQLSTLSTEGSDHAPGMVAVQEYYDTLIFMGWLRSARAGLESKHGSRADAKTHSDTGVLDSEEIDREIANTANKQIVDDMLEYKYGKKLRGKVRIVPSPINDEAQSTISEILKAALGNAQIGPYVFQKADVPAMYDILGIPILPEGEEPGAADMLLALGMQQDAQKEQLKLQQQNQPKTPAGNDDKPKTNGNGNPKKKLNLSQVRAELAKHFDSDWIERRLNGEAQ